jgi:hypothetical protein
VIGALLLAALGYTAVRAVTPGSSVRLRLGAGLLVGAALCALFLLLPGWSPIAAGIAALSLALALYLFSNPASRQPDNNHPIDLVAPAVLLLYARFATRPEEWSWQNWIPSRRDWFFIWGQKAHLFFANRGVDLAWLQSAPRDLSQPDYPWLWPLTVDWLALFHGSWEPRLAGVATVLLAAGLLLVFRDVAGRTLPPAHAAFATLAATGAACTPYLGLADGPFAAYAGAAILLTDDALRHDDPRRLRLAAILLGLCPLVKNEGIALLFAVPLAMLIASAGGDGARLGKRTARLAALWPAAVIALPWLVARLILGFTTDLFRGAPLRRAWLALTHPGEFFAHFRDVHEPNPWLYLAIGIALLLSLRRLRRETFLVAAIVGQLGFYVFAELVSPFGVGGQIGGSWGRLIGHLAAPLVYLAARGLLSEVDPHSAAKTARLLEEELR